MVLVEYGTFGMILFFLAVIIGIANIFILYILIRSFLKTYNEIKSKFTKGLLYFSTFLLFQNIISIIFISVPLLVPLQINESMIWVAGMPLLLINLVQLVALSILLKTIRE